MRGNDRNEETTERELLLEAERRVAALLPSTWYIALVTVDGGIDGYLVIRASDGTAARLVIEAKAGRLAGSEAVVAQMQMLARRTGLAPLLVASYLGPGLRRACEEGGVNYLDLTGWVSIRTDSPAVALLVTGAQRDPRPARPSVITRLSGVGAGRVVRALLNSREPDGVRAFAGRADVAPGTVSKVLKALDAESVIERDSGGRILAVRKRNLAERWTQDYKFLRHNTVGWYLAPRGVQRVVERATTNGPGFVGTGSLALRRYLPDQRVPVTSLSQVVAYVTDLNDTSRLLGLVQTERATANVILAVPYDPQLLAAHSGVGGQLPVVDVGQTVADLLTLPGRAPEEADQLMNVLAEEDPTWS